MYSKGVWKRRVNEIKIRVLQSDERLISVVHYDQMWNTYCPFLIITDRRIIDYNRYKPDNTSSINLEKIISNRLERGLVYSSLYLQFNRNRNDVGVKKFRDIYNVQGKTISRLLKNQLNKIKLQTPSNPITNSEDLLQILKFRLAKGEIARKDYINLKNDLGLLSEIKCSSCGQVNEEQSAFCQSCGVSL